MTWTHVAISSGSTTSASFSPTWPSGVQDGDVVVFCMGYAPDGGASATITSANGWYTTSAGGLAARFMWCRYSAAMPLPVIALTGGPTATWRMAAFRSTLGAAFGADYMQDGWPPAATSVTTTTPNTLLVMFGWAVGDQPAGWSLAGGSWSTLVSLSGSGSGNPNFANVALAWQQIASPSTVPGIYARLVSNRYFLLTVGEPQSFGGFFHE